MDWRVKQGASDRLGTHMKGFAVRALVLAAAAAGADRAHHAADPGGRSRTRWADGVGAGRAGEGRGTK